MSLAESNRSALELQWLKFLQDGLSIGTRKSYNSAQRRFINFCYQLGKVHACLRLCIKASKTDPFRRGTFIHIDPGKPPLCAVDALLQYLNLRGDSPGPLFLLQSGQPLTRSLLTYGYARLWTMQVSRGLFLAIAFGLMQQQWQHVMGCLITRFRHWVAGQTIQSGQTANDSSC